MFKRKVRGGGGDSMDTLYTHTSTVGQTGRQPQLGTGVRLPAEAMFYVQCQRYWDPSWRLALLQAQSQTMKLFLLPCSYNLLSNKLTFITQHFQIPYSSVLAGFEYVTFTI